MACVPIEQHPHSPWSPCQGHLYSNKTQSGNKHQAVIIAEGAFRVPLRVFLEQRVFVRVFSRT